MSAWKAGGPLVSVVTPSYNYARYIGRCLESVRAQSHGRIEHLVLDACSTDDSRRVVESFLGTYGLRVSFERDRGQADALNRGFERARGEVLCWLNADDFWLHDRVVERAVDALEEADIVTGTGIFVDEEGARTGRFDVEPGVMIEDLRYYDTLLQPATFWRRSVHRPLRDDLQYAFDWQLWLEMRRSGARLVVRDEEWAAYRMHRVNKTAQDPARRRGEIARILGEELGRWSPQRLWAQGVYAGFAAAESLHLPRLKSVVHVANRLMMRATRRRVWSC